MGFPPTLCSILGSCHGREPIQPLSEAFTLAWRLGPTSVTGFCSIFTLNISHSFGVPLSKPQKHVLF